MNADHQNSPPRLLIAGTGYGVGKSVVAAAIAAYRQACNHPPGQTVALHQAAVGNLDLASAWQSLQTQTPEGLTLIEAPGSLGTPVTYETTVADLAWDWRLPTLLVTAVSPDCLGQLVAHTTLAKARRCLLKGIVLNCQTPESEAQWQTWASPQQVAALTQQPVLGRIPYLPKPDDPSLLAEAGAALDEL